MKVSRRGVLLGVLAASSGTLAYRRFPWQVALRSPFEDFLLDLLRVVAVPDPVQVGEARLRADPSLKDQAQNLLDSVFADLSAIPETEEPAEALAAALRERARQQFETGDTLRVNHWILAQVEVDLCTLVALDRRPRGARKIP